MTLLNPLGLLALLALPLVVGLHLFRKRHRPRRIAGLFLFAPEGMSPAAGRRLSSLPLTLSLLLELLAALLLALWLAEPSVERAGTNTHLVLVLDDTASMGAVAAGESTADRVRRAVLERIGQASGVKVESTLILTGPRPRILAGPRASLGEVRAELAGWTPQAPGHDPGPALDLAGELAGPSGRMVYFSDHHVVVLPPACEFIAMGRPLTNAAVTGGRRRRAKGKETLTFTLAIWGEGSQVPVVVHPYGDPQKKLFARRVSLTPGKPVSLSFEMSPQGTPLVVSLPPDALAVDNRLTLLPPRDRRLGYAISLGDKKGGMAFREALRVVSGAGAVEKGRADLLIRNAADKGRGRAGTFVVHPPGAARESWQGPYLLHRADPLLDGVDLSGVVWTAGKMTLPGAALISVGERVLLSRDLGLHDRTLHLNLDPSASNLHTSVAWPILVYNLVQVLRGELPGPGPVNLTVGDVVAYRRYGDGRDEGPLELVDPAGRKRRGRGMDRLTWEADQPGMYTLSGKGGTLGRWTVHFRDPAESDLTGCGASRAPATAAAKGADPGAREESSGFGRILALLLLLVLVADWWVLAGIGRRRAA